MTVSPQRTPAPSTAAPAADALGLYVHWPFCVSKCPYCDFNSHVRAWIPQDRWREALLAELRYWAAATGRRPLGSIFFGGGTLTFGEMEPGAKHRISHRADAFRKLVAACFA